jgi:hypothetical protein
VGARGRSLPIISRHRRFIMQSAKSRTGGRLFICLDLVACEYSAGKTHHLQHFPMLVHFLCFTVITCQKCAPNKGNTSDSQQNLILPVSTNIVPVNWYLMHKLKLDYDTRSTINRYCCNYGKPDFFNIKTQFRIFQYPSW